MRLINADELMEHVWRDKLDSRELIAKMVENAPTVKEIPTRIPLEVWERLVSAAPKWIPVSKRLPKEREWIGTDTFGTTISDEVYVTFEMPNGERFTDHLSFQNGKLSPRKQSEIDTWHKGAKPIAWMPLPNHYEGEDK